MTPEEIQAMAKGLAQGQAVWYVLSAFAGGAIAGLGTYLAEKGKNRATKEDIAAITTKVKEVEDVFNRGLSNLNAHHQLRMVAPERRMQAHQEAFEWWANISESLLKGGWEDSKMQCIAAESWYKMNCLYLAEKSRDVFLDAIYAARNQMGQAHVFKDDPDGLHENLTSFKKAGSLILEEIGLPPLSQSSLSFFLKESPA